MVLRLKARESKSLPGQPEYVMKRCSIFPYRHALSSPDVQALEKSRPSAGFFVLALMVAGFHCDTWAVKTLPEPIWF